MQTGDVLLFPMEISSSGPMWKFKHAAVYCGEGEVIHFQSKCSTPAPVWDMATAKMQPAAGPG